MSSTPTANSSNSPTPAETPKRYISVSKRQSWVPLSITPSSSSPPLPARNQTSPLSISKTPSMSRTPSVSRAPMSPPLPSRSFRNSSTHNRNPSLLIPQVSQASQTAKNDNDNESDDDNEKNDDSENNKHDFNNNKDYDEYLDDSKDLPPIPKRPETGYSLEVPKKYGMERMEGENFTPASPRAKVTSDKFNLDNKAKDNEETYEKPVIVLMKFLIRTRVSHVERAIHKLNDLGLIISKDDYLNKIHSNDMYIEILSEIRTGSFDNPNKTALYSLLLNAIKVSDDDIYKKASIDGLDITEFQNLVSQLEPILKNGLSEKDQLVTDLTKIYSITKTKPNPLIAMFHSRIKSLSCSLILALILNDSILVEGREFQFLLMRAIEAYDETILINLYNSGSNPIVYFQEILNSNDFWTKFVLKLNELGLIEDFIDQNIIYSCFSMIDTVMKYEFVKDEFTSISLISDLCRFEREFSIISQNADSFYNDEAILKETRKEETYRKELEIKKEKYDELLNNYKQLNEEKFSNSSTLKKLEMANNQLKSECLMRNAELNKQLANFDVIRINNEKNLEVSKLNDSLKKEIERLKLEKKNLQKQI